MKTVSTNIANVIKKGTPDPISKAYNAFEMFIDAHKEYQTIYENEKTKRESIQADKEVRLADIQRKRDNFENYLEKAFGERRHLFDESFRVLDKGLEDNNQEVILGAMNQITEIAKTSPLGQANELMKNLDDPSVEVIDF